MPSRTHPTTSGGAAFGQAGAAPTRASLSVARRAELAAIHAAAHALGIDHTDRNPDSEYRSMLQRVGGHHSAADMSADQRAAVKRHLHGLQMRTGKGMSQADLARLLWQQLADAGALQDPSLAGLDALVKKVAGVSSVRFMGPAQGNKVIEALKAWQQRTKAASKAKAGTP